MDHSQLPHEQIQQRLTALEELFTHLQRTVGELNEVVIRQQQQVDRITAEVTRLAVANELFATRLEPASRPEDERPPHW